MAAAWTTIELTDLPNYLVGAQVSAINTAALAQGQTDRFTEIAGNVVTRIRNAISTSNQVLSATAGTIPPEMKGAACYIIIGQLQTSLPGLKLTEDQKKQLDLAEQYVRDVAAGKMKVTMPTDPETAPDVQGGPTVRLLRATGADTANAGFNYLGVS